MDYPFYLRKLTQLPPELLEECLTLLDQDKIIRHPHFVADKNVAAYKVDDENVVKVVDLVTTFLNPHISKISLYWHEVNLLAPKGLLAEHSDLAYAGYNRKKGTPLEIVLTHKIHVHLFGTSSLRFRRSKYEQQREFQPDVGGCYWYNNYVWHESHNPSADTNRVALSLIYHDKKWARRMKMLDDYDLKYNDGYQL